APKMAGYTKLFSTIVDSTIWQEDHPTRILWITLLALADRDGIVLASIPGLAARAHISVEQCIAALNKFQNPDPYSWSTEEEGRRIRKTEQGWFLINHAKYRKLLSAEDQREKNRIRVQRFRSKQKNKQVTLPVTPVMKCNDIAEAEAEAL